MKTRHCISIDNEVWDNAVKLDVNISNLIEEHLRGLTSERFGFINQISYCKLCEKKFNIEEMYMLYVSETKFNADISILKIYFVCKHCLDNVIHNQDTKDYDLDVIKEVLVVVKNHDKMISNPNNNLSVFDDWVLRYNNDNGGDCIKEVIEERLGDCSLDKWVVKRGEVHHYHKNYDL